MNRRDTSRKVTVLRITDADDTLHRIDCECPACADPARADVPLTVVDIARIAFYGLVIGVCGALCIDPAGAVRSLSVTLGLGS